MEFDYYRAAFRKKGGHALLDDEAVPFRAIKNNLRYWVADPFVFERDGETYIFAELFDYLRRRGVIGYSKLKANGSFSSWKEIIVEPYRHIRRFSNMTAKYISCRRPVRGILWICTGRSISPTDGRSPRTWQRTLSLPIQRFLSEAAISMRSPAIWGGQKTVSLFFIKSGKI